AGVILFAALVRSANFDREQGYLYPPVPPSGMPQPFKPRQDDEKLYFAAEMEEPNLIGYIAQHDTVVCFDNDFEIFIDVDDDARNYIELEFNALGAIFDIFYPKKFHRGGLPHGCPQGFYETRDSPHWDFEGMRIAARVDGSLNYPFDKDRGWTLEVSIPWKSLQETSRTSEKLHRNGSCLRVGMSRVEYPWPKVWPITDWNKGGGC
ncbi:MAG: carbohydrate-binding family 9-like protein, partial [Candidatus Latescibacterota bacterium]